MLRRVFSSISRWARFLATLACMAASHAAMAMSLPPSAACDAVWEAADLRAKGDALLMVLSPRMVYSLAEWRRMRAVAAGAGFVVVVARDPRVPLTEWASAVDAAGLPEIGAAPPVDVELAGRCGLLNHFPSTLVGRCGRPHPWPILGVMPDAAWRSLIVQRREAIACP